MGRALILAYGTSTLDESMKEFKSYLKESGYAKSVVFDYAHSARDYIDLGEQLDEQSISAYFDSLKKDGTLKQKPASRKKAGVVAYCRFVNGDRSGMRTEKKQYEKRRYRGEYRGCDEDCFNCKYPDCLKPGDC